MYNGTGLPTARGSGSNGYVQSNKFAARPNTNRVVTEPNKSGEGLIRKSNKDIIEHDQKRQIELKLVMLEEKLIDQDYTDAEIALKLDQARKSEVEDGEFSADFNKVEMMKAALGIKSQYND